MGAALSQKVTGGGGGAGKEDNQRPLHHVPTPVQPTSAQLARDETLRFVGEKRMYRVT
jgi:hypothetical protein